VPTARQGDEERRLAPSCRANPRRDSPGQIDVDENYVWLPRERELDCASSVLRLVHAVSRALEQAA